MKFVALVPFLFRGETVDAGSIIEPTAQELSLIFNRVAKYEEPTQTRQKEEVKTTEEKPKRHRSKKVNKNNVL